MISWILAVAGALVFQDYPEGVRNTEDSKHVPLAPEEALRRITVPEGFKVTLFAAEPNVAQPISIAFDGRGRLWVAECYSYRAGPWTEPVRDRILIFEDADGDGRFDRRKVFSDRARNLTSVLPGFGGVWACMTPKLVFLPDRDGDDVPDGEPEVLLDGWNDGGIGHCVFNGLTWGPDGWIYGNHGIQGESRVGKPGAPAEARVRFNGGIWRFHPTKKVFEVVCEGTTNPWGLDFDDHGQGFFTNCVIGHLWHMIPGAHYERMYGNDFTPNTYKLLKACSDHVHYAGAWEKSKSGGAEIDLLGGGHAHAGAMIYLGDNWPAKFRNTIFMHNIHGRRLNNDLLERRGSGYAGRHAPDFLRSEDPWWRGVAIAYGPDGGAYLTDWSDVGECHDNGNKVHRTSGRIYKVVHGTPRPPAALDVDRLPEKELVALQLHKNDWFVRQARRALQGRAAAGKDLREAHLALRDILAKNPDVTRKLRALWALHVTGATDEKTLLALHDHENEHVRTWAVRLVAEDRNPSDAVVAKWTGMAAKDASPLVRLFLASTLQRLAVPRRKDVAAALAARAEDAEDPHLPLMIWYAMEPVVATERAWGLAVAQKTTMPFVRQSITRRIASQAKRSDD